MRNVYRINEWFKHDEEPDFYDNHKDNILNSRDNEWVADDDSAVITECFLGANGGTSHIGTTRKVNVLEDIFAFDDESRKIYRIERLEVKSDYDWNQKYVNHSESSDFQHKAMIYLYESGDYKIKRVSVSDALPVMCSLSKELNDKLVAVFNQYVSAHIKSVDDIVNIIDGNFEDYYDYQDDLESGNAENWSQFQTAQYESTVHVLDFYEFIGESFKKRHIEPSVKRTRRS